MDVDQITKALHHFPNLQNIEFGPESWVPIVLPGGRRARQSGVRIWHENEHGTGTGVDDIEAFDEAERFWEIASNALSGCKIHHLSTASGDGFRGNFETERLWSLECVPKLFSQLHSVDLRIPFHSDGLGRLPQVLSELKLERIYITNHSSLRVLDILFESTVWSTLSHLQLSLSFDADTITAIFAKHKALRYLSISDSLGRQAQLARLSPFPKTLNKLSSPGPATNADASADINGGSAVFHDDACKTMWLDSEGMEDDGPKATSGSPDPSSENGIEPDFKVEDEYDPEPLSSKALGLYSTPPAPIPQSNVPSPLSKREPTPASSAKMEQKSSEPQELEPEVESKWASHMQLITFRATATKIADGYLKKKA
ncbi:hypothetical protein BDZ45DRAFT_807053 [Acephala macrosclerotiorum]|nr:hypothetical protein BDZ45DRAFT_807053 [Acephala macrosclerotiorum]